MIVVIAISGDNNSSPRDRLLPSQGPGPAVFSVDIAALTSLSLNQLSVLDLVSLSCLGISVVPFISFNVSVNTPQSNSGDLLKVVSLSTVRLVRLISVG